jgi:hypothetical protein
MGYFRTKPGSVRTMVDEYYVVDESLLVCC